MKNMTKYQNRIKELGKTRDQRTIAALNIRDYMRANGLSTRDLAKKAGISESAISMYMTGARYPGPEYLNKIAMALNVPISNIIEDTEMRDNEGEEHIQKIPEKYSRLSPENREIVDSVICKLLEIQRRESDCKVMY